MSTNFAHKLEGMEALLDALEQLPTTAMQKGAVRNALKKAGKPVADLARSQAPDSGVEHKQKLKNTIIVSPTLKPSQKQQVVRDRTSVTMFIGSTAPHAHLVEFGTGPRFWKNGNFTGQMGPQPFMRNAWDQQKDNVLKIFQTELWTMIYKAARRLAKRAAKGTLTKSQTRGLQ